MPNTRAIPVATEVYFVEPNNTHRDGYRPLGHYLMTVPPRIHETVTIPAALGAEPQRYRVHEVIHHMPIGRPVLGDEDDAVVTSCTCVISQHITEADLSRVVSRLCVNHATLQRAGRA